VIDEREQAAPGLIVEIERRVRETQYRAVKLERANLQAEVNDLREQAKDDGL
jgi:hypothetical protein